MSGSDPGPPGARPGEGMFDRRRALRAFSFVAAMAFLLAPAFWNGFALLQYDTGGYLARWFEGYLVPSRSTVYGLFLVSGYPLDFWPVVIVQTALTVWIVSLTLRAEGLDRDPFTTFFVSALLGALTTLPFLTGILLTDIFAGLVVLALYLLLVRGDALRRGERAALIVFAGFCAATHSATFGMGGAIVLATSILRLAIDMPAWRRIANAALAMTLGALMLLTANFALSGRFVWTPGGYGILFGRMLEDGIVARYLNEHCPDSRLRLCAHQAELPRDADIFLWNSSIFDSLGRFTGLGEEMRVIVLESLAAYPALQAKSAALAAATQLVRVQSGEGVLNSIWHTYAIIRRYTPSVVPALDAARQQRGEVSFVTFNRIHVPVALGAMALLPVIALVGFRRRRFSGLAPLAATVIVALLANAAICGALANPHPRYGARLAWVAPLVVVIAGLRQLRARRSLPHAPATDGQSSGARA
jgi:hypothetical protein